MALWTLRVWNLDLPCYLFVADYDVFLDNHMLGVELLVHLPALPYFSGMTARSLSALKRTYHTIHRLPTKFFKSLQGDVGIYKENRDFITEDGVRTTILQSRVASKYFSNTDLPLQIAMEQFTAQCILLREQFVQNAMAWSNPNPSSFTLQLKDVLPPLPVAAALPVPEFIQDEGDATADVQAVEIPIAVVPRRMGRPKHNALEVIAANNRRTDLTSAKRQIGIAARLLAQHNQEHGGINLHEALQLVAAKRKTTAGSSINKQLSKKQKIAVFTECINNLFPPLWAMLLGIDMAFMSFEAAATLRSFSGASFMQPPREWVSDYARILSNECEEAFAVLPRGCDPHPTLTDKDDGKGRPLTSKSAISTSLEHLLHWHIVGAIAEGHDLRPFLVGNVEGNRLQYKITFDTTQTCKQDLFMMGIVPHTFPLSAKQRTLNGNVQSANNVLILCLANIGESNHVIQNAVPGLRETILRLTASGTSVVLEGGVEHQFNVEFHVAADLKALWLALGLKNFVCPFCTQTSFNENISGSLEVRELSGCLGVPSNRVHLCSLHATLRIVERLVKNAASFVYQHTDKKERNKKLSTLSTLIESSLNRKKFKITVASKEGEKSEEMPTDEVFIDNDDALGSNIGLLMKNNVLIKLSALTGSQAVKILEGKRVEGKDNESIYLKIIDITEGAKSLN